MQRPARRPTYFPDGTRVFPRFRAPLLLLCGAIAYGTIGYAVLEDWSLLDALYMTIITLTTIGFAEVQPLDTQGRVFTLTVILLGFVTVFVLVGILAQLVASGELGEPLRRRRMRRRLTDLKDHYIVCGLGRVGRATLRDLVQADAPVCVVDADRSVVRELERMNVPYHIGDATSEASLTEAGIERARGLISSAGSDAVNVYITLTARAMNPHLFLVSRASDPDSTDRLKRAGADRVVSPYALSGARMAFLAMRPAVVDFMDMVTLAPDHRLEEVQIRSGSELDGRTLQQAVAGHEEVIVVALKKSGGDLIPTPPLETTLQAGDILVALGPTVALEKIASGDVR